MPWLHRQEQGELNEKLTRISVTEFRNYLACPFRFYLKKCLEMEDVIYENNEMDARSFGTIAHAVLEDFGNCPEMRGCSDPGTIREFMEQTLEKHFTHPWCHLPEGMERGVTWLLSSTRNGICPNRY